MSNDANLNRKDANRVLIAIRVHQHPLKLKIDCELLGVFRYSHHILLSEAMVKHIMRHRSQKNEVDWWISDLI
jgi:hypothetical protein